MQEHVVCGLVCVTVALNKKQLPTAETMLVFISPIILLYLKANLYLLLM